MLVKTESFNGSSLPENGGTDDGDTNSATKDTTHENSKIQ